MQALVFLVNAVVGFFSTLLLLRFMMQWCRVSFAGQLGEFVIRLTDWAVRPMRRIVPGVGGLDWASLVAALWLQVLQAALILSLSAAILNAEGFGLFLMLLMLTIRGLLRLFIYIVMGVVILEAVLSWVNPHAPLAGPVRQLARPFLAPIRRFVPPISGVDLSPLVLILLLQVLLMFI